MDLINRLLNRHSPNTSASTSPEPPSDLFVPKSGNETILKASPEHEVKVKFAREFADAEAYPPGRKTTENSLSSASSFLSVTSTLSTKSSSGICLDSPARSNDSYTNLEVPGLDELISACEKIRLDNTNPIVAGGDHSFADATFTSATDELQLDQTFDLARSGRVSPSINDATQFLEKNCNTTYAASNPPSPSLNRNTELDTLQKSFHSSDVLQNSPVNNSVEYETASETFLQSKLSNESIHLSVSKHQLIESSAAEISTDLTANEPISETTNFSTVTTNDSANVDGEFKVPFPVKAPKIQENINNQTITIEPIQVNHNLSTIFERSNEAISSTNVSSCLESTLGKSNQTVNESITYVIEPVEKNKVCENSTEKETLEGKRLPDISVVQQAPKDIDDKVNLSVKKESELVEENKLFSENKEEIETGDCDLDSTIVLDSNIDFSSELEGNQKESDNSEEVKEVEKIEPSSVALHTENLNLPQDYGEFTPQRQSTSLNCIALKQNSEVEQCLKNREASESQFFDAQNSTLNIPSEFEKLEAQSQSIANDTIDNTSIELIDEPEQFVSASNDLFRDPTNFDFLLTKTEQKNLSDRLRDSLYQKFDPLVSNTSMLPQGNGAATPSNDERNGEKDISVPNIGTPKRNPAIAAIDRLLFYSPMTPGIQKNEESEKIESPEKNTSNTVPVVDSAMAKELELVKATVLQLEEQLEKEKEENKNYQKQKEDLQETINQLQKQIAKEIKHKNQINVVVDEYEKSISRLVAEREKDRKNQDAEKTALLEELQEVKNHLAASEAAFNDVHAKYERLKVVCTTSKNNEIALKESIAENVATIKALEHRYEQVKIHAAARLDKANEELNAIYKQHESEILKLRAMLRKEELKSNSLTEMIEQKVKENKELTKILDELLGRGNLVDK
ncbi:progesterone-induced-blocking factor 1 isoform X2 [Chelonus insularis]|uniref:progesterone-induced-blocking factor 1 isoform X2 n=1 Tax=Chelonus insularis TaxID=460826 RepID=UPI001588EC84|nr:progesterone-induced-blocking factor 1 isoform X2 [Chelonus insularis]